MDLCWLNSRPEDGTGLPGLRAKIIDLDEGLHTLVQPQASAWNQWPDAPHLRINIGLYNAPQERIQFVGNNNLMHKPISFIGRQNTSKQKLLILTRKEVLFSSYGRVHI